MDLVYEIVMYIIEIVKDGVKVCFEVLVFKEEKVVVVVMINNNVGWLGKLEYGLVWIDL